jgi:hypothetical protein
VAAIEGPFGATACDINKHFPGINKKELIKLPIQTSKCYELSPSLNIRNGYSEAPSELTTLLVNACKNGTNGIYLIIYFSYL